ncbi:MAG: hypothetical protein MUO43_02525, partial [Desulfobacterales bacterium]|nr:hypothetical protein [Desulfobacterales bacterium]
FNLIVNVFAMGIPPEALKGVRCQMFWYFDMTGFRDAEVVKLSNEFTKRYMAEYGEPPDPYGCSAYMGVKNVIRAMELAKSSGPKKAYNAMLANPKWTGPKGPERIAAPYSAEDLAIKPHLILHAGFNRRFLDVPEVSL